MELAPLVPGRDAPLAGEPEGPALEGHSDADVALHAVADALFGAVARGDIGLERLVAHVYVHELAHHFGWSDEDIAAIDRWWEP